MLGHVVQKETHEGVNTAIRAEKTLEGTKGKQSYTGEVTWGVV